MYQSNPPLPPKETIPTMYDLPSELLEESGLPDEFRCIILPANDFNLYYNPRRSSLYKCPDWYIVLGITNSNQ